MKIVLILSIFFISACSNPEQDKQQLLEAASNGDNNRVSQLLDRQVNPNCRDKCEWTPLMQAILYNHPQIVKTLLAKGAVSELADEAGYTPLLIAATHNRTNIIPLLLDHQANINYQEPENLMTALMIAARAGHTESVKLLLNHKADKMLLDKQGRSALKWAQLKQHASIAQLLQ